MAKGNKNNQKLPKQFNLQKVFLIAAILSITAIVFSGVTKCDFLTNWDDDGYIIQNTHIYKINAENIGNMFSSYYKSNYQPLSVFSYAVEFALFGLKPSVYHITNLLFHLLNTFLVFVFVEKLVRKTNVAVVTALFFGIHTMHVESVAWIAERKDVMYGAFYLLSMISYLNYFENREDKKHLWFSFGWFAASCLSKSMAVTLPIILLAIDYFKDRKIELKTILEKAPFFITSLIFGIVALNSQSGQAMDIAPEFGFVNRIFIVSYAIMFYVFKMFYPSNLAAIQYYPPNDETLPTEFYIAPVAIIAIVLLVWKVKSLQKELIFGLGFFLLSISLVLQIIPVGHAFASERYSYLPYVGLFFIIGILYNKISETTALKKYQSIFIVILIAYTAMIGYMTKERVKIWENSINLFSDNIEKYPTVAHAYWMRGNTFKQYGESAQKTDKNVAVDLFNRSINDYTKAIELDPQYSKAYFNRGGSFSNLQQYEKSIEDYNKSLEIDPTYSPALNNRGNSYANIKQPEKAIEDYKKAIEVDSTFVIPYKSLGDIYINTQRHQEAIHYYEQAIAINSKYADAYHGKGIAFYNLNKKNEACIEWQKSAELGFQASTNFIQKYCK